MPLSKSSFKKFLQCPEYFWFDQHRPEVLTPIEASDFEMMLAEQAKKVEQSFYSMFPEAVHIAAKGIEAVEETNKILLTGAKFIAQAAFSTNDLFAQSDMVQFKEDKHIDIYEIKSSSSMQNMSMEDAKQVTSKEEHIIDLAFQYEVATQAGYIIEHVFLVELNKQYVRKGDLELTDLFNIVEVSSEVTKQLGSIQEGIQAALSLITSDSQPVTCNCKFLPRKKHCPAFAFMHPDLLGYSIYDLARINTKRLKKFADDGIYRIEDIPAEYDLIDSYRDQVLTWNNDKVIIKTAEINTILFGLTFPLYFLDYETTAPGIPLFDSTRPYQHIPFQYSLHILDQDGSAIRHCEYLHTDRTNPCHEVSKHLIADIGDTGTIVVWNKTFESKCNQNLAEITPHLKDFLLGMNTRMFDLMEIFSKKLYVDKNFRGSHSIKKVLPVLVPELSYSALDIGDGGKATCEWARMVFEIADENEKKIVAQQLLDYCKLDTLAMVEIYKKLSHLR